VKQLTLYAYAKLNLALKVGKKRSDGYHDMDMIMQSVSLHDTVYLSKEETGIALSCNIPELPCGADNIAYRAAEKFFDFTGVKGGISIALEKGIPFQAGMAGGSADAAAVLIGLDHLYETGLSVDDLASIGVTLGADVPFCLSGSTAHVTGMGERIEPIAALPSCYFVIAKPKQGISTGAAFAAIDSASSLDDVSVKDVRKGIETGDLVAVSSGMGNTFEQVTHLGDVFAIKEEFLRNGALGALMSGSGSAVFGMFDHEKTAADAHKCLSERHDEVYLAHPVRCGVEMIKASE